MKIDIKSLNMQELALQFKALGEPSFRAKQVFIWLHKGAASFHEMTNLSKPLRETLSARYFITVPTVERKLVSKLDGTIKYLWRLKDGNCIETVLMKYRHGNSICISTEVGCKMGCVFCASTQAGFVRRLAPSEILDQVLFTQLDSGEPISNIVLMGTGESSGWTEHRHAPHFAFDLWSGGANRTSRAAGSAADTLCFAPCAGR